MYKRTIKPIEDFISLNSKPGKYFIDAQFGKLTYFYEISGCITTRIDAGATYLIDVHYEESNIATDKQNILVPEELRGKKFRIRKPTPRECFRLMGVDDTDIDKIQATGISGSAQYKLAGNSIVVDTLYHIFRKLLIEKDNENAKQLTFF